jgi:hypothetical protein
LTHQNFARCKLEPILRDRVVKYFDNQSEIDVKVDAKVDIDRLHEKIYVLNDAIKLFAPKERKVVLF